MRRLPEAMSTHTDPRDRRRAASSTARNTTLQFVTQTGASVLALCNAVVMFRVLGAGGRGELAFLTVMANLTTSISLFGIDVAHGNILGQAPERAKHVATNAWVLSALLSITAGTLLVAAFLAIPGIQPNTTWPLIIAALLSVPCMVVALNLRSMAFTEYHFTLANTATAIVPVINLSGNVAFALAGQLSVTVALFTWITGQVMSLVVLAVWVSREIGYARPNLSLMNQAFRFGAKNHLTSTMQLANFRLDQWFVGLIAGNAQLGIYANAVAFAETLFYLPQAVANAQRPDLIRATERDAARQGATGARLAIVVTAIGAVALVVLAPWLMDFFFGKEGAAGAGMLQMLAPGAIGIVLTKVLSITLVSQNRPLATAMPIGVGLVTTIALDLLLIPAHGGFGAAVASTAAYMVAGVLMAAIFLRKFGLPASSLIPRGDDLRILAAPAAGALRSRRAKASL